jgi:hypothetical protein
MADDVYVINNEIPKSSIESQPHEFYRVTAAHENFLSTDHVIRGEEERAPNLFICQMG